MENVLLASPRTLLHSNILGYTVGQKKYLLTFVQILLENKLHLYCIFQKYLDKDY